MKTKQVVAFLMAATLAVTSGGVSALASQNAADAQQKEAAIEESLEGDDAKAGDDAEADAKDDAEAEGEAAEDEVAAESQQQEDTEESLEGDDAEAKAEAAADEDAAEALQEEAATEESIRVDDAEGDAAVSDNGLRMVAELAKDELVSGTSKSGGLEDLLAPYIDENGEVKQDLLDEDKAKAENIKKCIDALNEISVEPLEKTVEYGDNVTFTVNWKDMQTNVTIKSLALVRMKDETEDGYVVDVKNGDAFKEQWAKKETTLNWNAVEDEKFNDGDWDLSLPQGKEAKFKVRAIVAYNNDARTAWYDLPCDNDAHKLELKSVNVVPANPGKFIEDVLKKTDLGEIEISESKAEAQSKTEANKKICDENGNDLYPYPKDMTSEQAEETVDKLIRKLGPIELAKKIGGLNDELGIYSSFGAWDTDSAQSLLNSLSYTPGLKTVPLKFKFYATKCTKPAGAEGPVDEGGKKYYILTIDVPYTVVQKAMKVDIKAYVDGRVVNADGKKDGVDQYNLKLNGHLTLQADVLPKNLSDDSVNWNMDPKTYVTFVNTESANKKIVEAVKKGSTKITATANDGGGASSKVIIDSKSGVATSDIDFSFFPATKEYEGDAPISDYLYDELHNANAAVEGVGKYEIRDIEVQDDDKNGIWEDKGTDKNNKDVLGRDVANDGIREDDSGYVYKYQIMFTLDDKGDAVNDANSDKWASYNGNPCYVKTLSLRVTPATITEERALKEILKEDYSKQGTTLTVDLGTTLDGLVNESAKAKYTIRWYEANGTTPVNSSGVALPIGTSTYVLKYDEGPDGKKWGADSQYAGYKLDYGSHTVTFTITVKDPELNVYADTLDVKPDKYKNGSIIKLYAFKDPETKKENFFTDDAWHGIYDITVTWIKDGDTILNGDIVEDTDGNVYYYKDAYWLLKKQANQGNSSDGELDPTKFVPYNIRIAGSDKDKWAEEAFKGTGTIQGNSIAIDDGFPLPLKVTSASEGTYTADVHANINAAGRNSAWFSGLNAEMQQKYSTLIAHSASKEVRVTDILFGGDAVTVLDGRPDDEEQKLKDAAEINVDGQYAYKWKGDDETTGLLDPDRTNNPAFTYGDTASKKLNVRIKAKDIVSYEVCYINVDDKNGEEHVVQTVNATDEASQILFADGSLIGEGYKGVSIGNLDAGTYDFYVRVKTKSDTTGVRSGKIRIKVNPKLISDAFFDKSLIKVESIAYGQNYNTAKVSCADAAISSEVQFKVKEDQIAKKTGPVTVTVVVANPDELKNYKLNGKWQFQTVLDVVAYPVTVTALDKTCEAGPIPTFTDADWTANIPEEILAINGDTVASVLDVKLTVQKDGAQTAFVTAGTYDIVPNATPKNNNFSVGETKWGTLTVTGGTGSDIETNDIQFNKKQIVFTNIGKTREFAAAVVPATESNAGLTFESDNESVATVEVTDAENGKAVVTAVANGEANIVVTAPNGVSKSLHVTVKQEPKKVVISRSGKTVSGTISVSVGKKYDFDAKVQPSTVYKKGVTWSTSNAKIATVGKKGKVTVKAAGTVKITATAKGGAKSKTITLKAK